METAPSPAEARARVASGTRTAPTSTPLARAKTPRARSEPARGAEVARDVAVTPPDGKKPRGPSVRDLLERATPAPLTPCPCCYQLVPLHRINHHIDTVCAGLVLDPAPAVAAAPVAAAARPTVDVGAYLPVPWETRMPVAAAEPVRGGGASNAASAESHEAAGIVDVPVTVAEDVREGAPTADTIEPANEDEGALSDAEPARYYERHLLDMLVSVHARYRALLRPDELERISVLRTLPGTRARSAPR